MESVFVCSRNNLFSLWKIIKERFPYKSVFPTKMNGRGRKISVDIQYLDEFCKIFSQWLHHQIKDKILEDVMKESFTLSNTERQRVNASALQFIQENKGVFTEIIYQKALILLLNNKKIYLEGFTNFSIREYREKIEEVIELCFEQYLIEKEYLEFINLMQCYIEVEGYRFGKLTVVATANGRYSFYDENFQNITTQCMQQFVTEFENEIPEPDDCLITILILLLPEKIRIYGSNHIKNDRILKTLEKLFGNRIEFFSNTDHIIPKKL